MADGDTGAAGVAGGATVTGVQFRGEIGTGQTGRNARFALTWDDLTDRPASVVAKFPSADPAARAAAFANGTYIKEWFFYHDLVDTVSIRTPAIYAAHFDLEAPDFVLLMEDVSGSVQGDQIAGLSVDEAALAARRPSASMRHTGPIRPSRQNSGRPVGRGEGRRRQHDVRRNHGRLPRSARPPSRCRCGGARPTIRRLRRAVGTRYRITDHARSHGLPPRQLPVCSRPRRPRSSWWTGRP
ncbi:MAG: hypothetical protein R2710_19555 [Acidimicrobiales bacterium]